MTMDNKSIETLAVNAVKNSIVSTDYLDQFIAENDKEPSWDGFVYIHENKGKKKDNISGRVPVQIKGTLNNDFLKSEIKFPVSKADLRNYLRDGGVVFFVVYIGNGGKTQKIYYNELTPIKLRKILAQMKGQKTKRIYFKEFPTDSNKISTIFMNFFQNYKKQYSFSNAKLSTLEELEKSGNLEGLIIPVSSVGIEDPQLALLSNDVYIYAKVRGSSIPQPLEMIPEHMITEEERKARITVCGKEFYAKMRVRKTATSISYLLGNSITIDYSKPNKLCTISYTNTSMLRELAIDLDFMISYIETGTFQVNDNNFSLDKPSFDYGKFNIEEQKKKLKYLKQAVKALDALNCKEDLNLSKLCDNDFRILNILITSFVDKKPVKNLEPGLPQVVHCKLGNLQFIFNAIVTDEPTTYELADFFKTEAVVFYKGPKGDHLSISQYAILTIEDLQNICNINFDKLLPSFQKQSRNYDTMDGANWFLLKLLSAYDGTNRTEILKTAHEFADWILQASDEELDQQIRVLNYLQVIKRERSLTAEETAQLFEMIEDKKTREDSLVGAYLLLDQQPAAEKHFAKMKLDKQKDFKKFPIYHFWNAREEKGNE